MDFGLLVHEAKLALQEAGDLCAASNKCFESSVAAAEHSLVLWARAQFLSTAFSSQLQNMGNAYILLNYNITEIESRSKHSLDGLKSADTTLERLLDDLKATPLQDDPSRNLYAFVHSEDVSKLRKQVTELYQRLEASSGLSSLPAQAQREIGQLRSSMPQLAPSPVESFVVSLDSISTSLQEMALLLEGVTQHYDLCCEAATLSDPHEILEVQQVLEDDQVQLQDALKSLQITSELVAKLDSNVASNLSALQSKVRDLDSFFEKCDDFTNKRLEACVNQLDQNSGQFEQKFARAAELKTEVEGLCEYYLMFQQGYNALNKEKQRRQKYEQQLVHLKSEIDATMKRHRLKELGARQDFINRYGEYLPGDIWSELDDEPEIYSLQRSKAPAHDSAF